MSIAIHIATHFLLCGANLQNVDSGANQINLQGLRDNMALRHAHANLGVSIQQWQQVGEVVKLCGLADHYQRVRTPHRHLFLKPANSSHTKAPENNTDNILDTEPRGRSCSFQSNAPLDRTV
jgi:hypothetical protein